jgi:hypothetical protein
MTTVFQDNLIHEIAKGVHYQWIEHGRIIKYIINSHDPAAVDALVAFVRDLMDDWSPERPYRAIYDATNRSVMLTGYARNKLSELDNCYPEIKGRVAGVVTSSALKHAAQLFIMMRGKRGREKRIFTNEADAIRWLLEE